MRGQCLWVNCMCLRVCERGDVGIYLVSVMFVCELDECVSVVVVESVFEVFPDVGEHYYWSLYSLLII